MSAQSRKNWRLFLVVGLAAALVFSVAGFVFVQQRSVSLVDRAAAESEEEALAFANALSAWILASLQQTHLLSRVVQITLEGDSVYVVISYLDDVIVDERAAGWERADLPSIREDSEKTVLLSLGGTLVLDTLVPVGEDPNTPATVRIGTVARYLEVQLRSTELSTAATAFGLWALILLFFGWPFGRKAPASASAATRPTDGHLAKGLRGAPVSVPLMVDTRAKTATYQDRSLSLAPKPFQLLELLVQDHDKVFNEQEIIDHVWTDSDYATASDVRQCVYRLRQRLNEIEAGLGNCIANVKGFGYRFDPDKLDQQTSGGI